MKLSELSSLLDLALEKGDAEVIGTWRDEEFEIDRTAFEIAEGKPFFVLYFERGY